MDRAKMDPSVLIQHQIRQNAMEMHEYMKDLGSWEDEIRKKDAVLRASKKKVPPSAAQSALPPVRGSSGPEIEEVSVKGPSSSSSSASSSSSPASSSSAPVNGKRIKPRNYQDYSMWDKYDPDQDGEVEDVSKSEKQEQERAKQQQLEEEQKRQQAEKLEAVRRAKEEDEKKSREKKALDEKDAGNTAFNQGKHQEAIQCYSRSLGFNPSSAIVFANRAMAYIKLGNYQEAERDCNNAIKLDKTYMKAYLRRALCHTSLGNLPSAIADYEHVLKSDPTNAAVKADLEKVKAQLQQNSAQPQQPQPQAVKQEESKKKRVIIQEVEEEEEQQQQQLKAPEDLKKEEVPAPTPAPTPAPAPVVVEEKPKPAKKVAIQEVEEEVIELSTPGFTRLASQDPSIKSMKQNTPAPKPQAAPAAAATPKQAEPVSTPTPPKQAAPTPSTPSKIQEVPSSPAPAPSPAAGERKTPATPTPTPASPSPVSSASMASKLPKEAPKTLYEFERIYNMIKSDSATFAQYLKMLDIPNLPKLFKQGLDPVIFIAMMDAINRHFLAADDKASRSSQAALDLLRALSKTSRFDMTIMFCSSKDKKIIQEIFAKLAEADSGVDAAEVTKVRSPYGV